MTIAGTFVGNYQARHQHPLNKLAHSIGIPLIVLALPMRLVFSARLLQNSSDVKAGDVGKTISVVLCGYSVPLW